ncbi:hypothetical protein [Alienimonas sp. DA493]|uniref:hypothetical protein n=1 Tax=Alienimonas sp. DA493 TaxID=3373605 RepID=UPI0037551D20
MFEFILISQSRAEEVRDTRKLDEAAEAATGSRCSEMIERNCGHLVPLPQRPAPRPHVLVWHGSPDDHADSGVKSQQVERVYGWTFRFVIAELTIQFARDIDSRPVSFYSRSRRAFHPQHDASTGGPTGRTSLLRLQGRPRSAAGGRRETDRIASPAAAAPQFARIAAAWPHLPATVKAGGLAMAEAGVAAPEDGATVPTGG